ncbi:GNAT family N-acetyltransferase [Actinoplanes sp. NPDC049599]|uniref:GNAT family N-acetyltransferase n=1 Tax=Actinoplanes sp. NPDC049599 TaxID=3363903 RepID=UPI0037A62863
MRLQRLTGAHATAVLRFEQENREWFARSVPDRGDDYFATFPDRHAALLAEQDAGDCHFHVLIDEDGAVVARLNLVDVADGQAELGFRVAQRAAGRGVATAGVRQICALARTGYGLRRLIADADRDNAGSLTVLRRTGFRPVGAVLLAGRPGIRHRRDLIEP